MRRCWPWKRLRANVCCACPSRLHSTHSSLPHVVVLMTVYLSQSKWKIIYKIQIYVFSFVDIVCSKLCIGRSGILWNYPIYFMLTHVMHIYYCCYYYCYFCVRVWVCEYVCACRSSVMFLFCFWFFYILFFFIDVVVLFRFQEHVWLKWYVMFLQRNKIKVKKNYTKSYSQYESRMHSRRADADRYR